MLTDTDTDELAGRLRIFGRDPSAPTRSGAPLNVTWESALEQLSRLPRMFIEPDGSFLWTGTPHGQQSDESSGVLEESAHTPGTWQLEGTVYDDGRVVRYIDLSGNCPMKCWQHFLNAFEATWSSIVVELLQDHRVVDGQWLQQTVMRSEGEERWK